MTKSFIESAQDRVHRDIGPRLKASVEKWLPVVTEGRYKEILFDPANLSIRVVVGDGRELRDIGSLSHGTAEQIYLLLRLALAEHLVTNGETIPMILDDVTVQFDKTRTVAVLQTLKRLSEEMQIILFSQEEDVLLWAEKELDLSNGRDLIVKLAPLPAA